MPDDPDRTNTPALGVHLAGTMLNAGTAQPAGVSDPADVLDRAIRRCAKEAAIEVHRQNGNGKKAAEARNWIKFALSVLVLVLGGWWVLGEKLAERPTEPKVEKMIKERRPTTYDDEMMDDLKLHEDRLHEQQRSLDRIETDVAYVKEGVSEIKEQLTSPRRRPR
jgi:hypothetical protein